MLRKDRPASKGVPRRAESGGIGHCRRGPCRPVHRAQARADAGDRRLGLALRPGRLERLGAGRHRRGPLRGDSPEAHAADTIRAGAGIVDEEIALLLAARGAEPHRGSPPLRRALRQGPRRPSRPCPRGRPRRAPHRARQGRHRRPRHHGGADRGGARHALDPRARRLGRARARSSATARSPASSLPAPAPSPATPSLVLDAAAVVLATGGSGQLYAITTNPRESRGEGIAMAARAGAIIADAEFVQFHPTAIDIGRDPAPLATEALRGEGAMLINGRGERFMRALHPDAELAPRDIVARGVYREVMSGRGAFLDCRKIGANFPSAFPPSSPPASRRASTRAASRSRSRRLRTTTWAASHRCERAHHHRRPVGLRRGRLDRRAWRQPARLQFAARSGRVRRPRGRDIAERLPSAEALQADIPATPVARLGARSARRAGASPHHDRQRRRHSRRRLAACRRSA